MIIRKLKEYEFIYDEELKELVIFNLNNNQCVALDKIRMFSLFRFLIRVSQRMATPRRKKVIK